MMLLTSPQVNWHNYCLYKISKLFILNFKILFLKFYCNEVTEYAKSISK
jgi:hypothetical protein